MSRPCTPAEHSKMEEADQTACREAGRAPQHAHGFLGLRQRWGGGLAGSLRTKRHVSPACDPTERAGWARRRPPKRSLPEPPDAVTATSHGERPRAGEAVLARPGGPRVGPSKEWGERARARGGHAAPAFSGLDRAAHATAEATSSRDGELAAWQTASAGGGLRSPAGSTAGSSGVGGWGAGGPGRARAGGSSGFGSGGGGEGSVGTGSGASFSK